MSVAVRLVNQFYKKFGEETATELVGWLETMEANSQARLTILNESSAEMFRRDIRVMFAEQDARIERRFAQFEKELARVQSRLTWQILVTTIGFLLTILRT